MFRNHFPFLHRSAVGLLLAVTLSLAAANRPAADPKLEPSSHMSTIARTTAFLLTNYHFSQQKIDEKLSEQLFLDYFKTLDPAHIFFTQQDLADFEGVKKELGSQIRRGNVQFAFDVFKRFLTRLDEYEKFTTAYLKTRPSLNGNDTYEYNRTKLPWVKNRKELETLWEKKIRNDLILLEMLDRSKKENSRRLPVKRPLFHPKGKSSLPRPKTGKKRNLKKCLRSGKSAKKPRWKGPVTGFPVSCSFTAKWRRSTCSNSIFPVSPRSTIPIPSICPPAPKRISISI